MSHQHSNKLYLFLTFDFWKRLVIAFLCFEGIEHLLQKFLATYIPDFYFSFGAVGIYAWYLLQFHVICCAVPALAVATYGSLKGRNPKTSHKSSQEFSKEDLELFLEVAAHRGWRNGYLVETAKDFWNTCSYDREHIDTQFWKDKAKRDKK